MIDSGLRLAVDPLYPPPSFSKRQNLQVSIIQWQLTFDESLDVPKIDETNKDENSLEVKNLCLLEDDEHQYS
jgi:hypothetical protein